MLYTDFGMALLMAGLDVDLIKNVSFQVRALLARTCPEMVSTAESFAGDVLYLPNSALGRSPELNPDTGMLGIRSEEVKPFWAEVPMLYFFWERGFIPALPRQRRRTQETVPIEYKLSGDVVFVSLPGQDKPLEVPVFYLGKLIQAPARIGWLATARGRGGGVRLEVDAASITLFDILQLTDGHRVTRECLLGFKACEDDSACVMHCSWKPIKQELTEGLGNYTLAALAAAPLPAWLRLSPET